MVLKCGKYNPFLVLLKVPNFNLIRAQTNSNHIIRKRTNLWLTIDPSKVNKVGKLEIGKVLCSLVPKLKRSNFYPSSVIVKSF